MYRATYDSVMRKRNIQIAIALGATVLLVGLAWVLLRDREDPARPAQVAGEATYAPAPWRDVASARDGRVDVARTAFAVGEVAVEVPQPTGAKLAWKHVATDDAHTFRGEGNLGTAQVQAQWVAANGNPHTRFIATIADARAALTSPIASRVTLPAGEVTYVDATLQRALLGEVAVAIGSLTHGPIVWRRGDDTVALSQWRADRVELQPVGDNVLIDFVWWDPAMHNVEACADEVGAQQVTVDAALSITFGDTTPLSRGRLPGGVTSAVAPLFVDPHDHEEPTYRDGASSGASDLAARARTIAFGHSSPADARYGNGGLVGLDVGGTIVLPSIYPDDDFATLRDELAATSVDVVSQDTLRPATCEQYAKALVDRRPLLGASVAFDGKFPNQVDYAPSTSPDAITWHATELTGRRKDVVTQTLSSTYLTRLATARGIAVLEIPLVATRNPLVAAAAEALLEPERNGHWTIHEELARALGGVELLAENESFDFVSLHELTHYTRNVPRVTVDPTGPGRWSVHNGDEAVRGFTMIVDGAAQPTIDAQPVQSQQRRLPDGATQTWFWWDLDAGATAQLEVHADVTPASQPVTWRLDVPE